jgi:hypothetical protein
VKPTVTAKPDGFKDFVLDQLADLRGVSARAIREREASEDRSSYLVSRISPEDSDQIRITNDERRMSDRA